MIFPVLFLFFYIDRALSNDQRTTGFSTFGRLFVLAFPGSDVDIEVDMHLQTHEHNPFRVNLTTKWHPNKTEQSAIIRNFLYEVIVLTVDETIKLEPVVQTRFTYHLEALYPFQVLCMFYLRDIERMMHSLTYFMAVPVEGWALRYLVPYAGKWQSIQIINGQSRQAISLLLKYRGNVKLVLELNGQTLSMKEENRIYLSEFEAFSLQLCTEELKWENLAGSLIWAEYPFSVLHGSCIMKEYMELEHKYECLAAFSLDYVLPLTEYAKHFIIVKSVHIRAYVVVVFEKERTKLNYNRIDLPDSKPKEVSRKLGNLIGPAELTTSHPVVVVVVSNAGCSFYRKHSYGDITIGLIVPLGLFIDTYFWLYKTTTYPTDDCLLLVYKRFQEKYIYIDDAPITNMAGKINVSGVNDYVALDVEIPVNWNMIVHQVYSKNAHKFGAYLYGRHSATEYRISITPLGFVAYNGFILKTGLCNYKYSKEHYPHSQGDYIDNDCDGETDEEKEDGVDNDKDGMIDEDKALPPLGNSQWSVV
ncbi:uncharacterized protein LOC106064545 [Biomphalaria glabrata]|uniref:Uncharacterized protein LOC106064545 n=1 Tax=Biomphalaria glabrata TaxID=6526 RepID=A0A9W2ZFF5_BIOGL|nr:uncharacterized protein LOC106064545 [Biomphalaria glabrata]